MEKTRDQPTPTVSKAWLVEQIKICLRSGDHSRALELLRGAAAEFPSDNDNDNDAKWSELEKLAHDGVKRNAEVNRLITESQNLFARQKAPEAIQLLRQAYELDKNNSLSRAILANALVEHAHSLLETDWREAEALAKQALDVNPAHPTAKNIRSLVLERKKASTVEDWVAQARKLQSSGDLFAALAWVEEGMAFHPDDHKLLQVQDAIQRDQAARRRQSRRRDLEDLRRMDREIDGAADVAAKQALAERIQGVAAKYWTDGEFLSVANGLLQRLGLVPQDGSTTSPQGEGATVIFHVPRPSAPKPSLADASQAVPSLTAPSPVAPQKASTVPANTVSASKVPPSFVPASIVPTVRVPVAAPERPAPSLQAVTVVATEGSAPAAKVRSSASQTEQLRSASSTTLILVSAAVIVLVAGTFFFTRKHYAPPIAKTPAADTTISAPVVSTPVAPTPAQTTPAQAEPAPTNPEPSLPALAAPSERAPTKAAVPAQPPAESVPNLGTLLVVAGQNDAKVFLNGKLQPQRTQAGQLRLPNLEVKDYVVQVSKSGLQDPPQQKIRIRKGEQARLVFNLQPQPQPQPQPRLASLTIQGGAPGTTVLVDQTSVGTIQADGTLSVATVNPGDHTVELRKQGFKPRQLKKHFVAGGAISLAAADAALEAAPGELKITFSPPDASVALVKGDLLKMVSSGVPLNLPAGTYTLTARTAERFTRSSTLEVVAGQSKTVDLSLAPNGMSKWEDVGAWKHEGDSFIRKGGEFVLYGVVPTSGTFAFSAMAAKGRVLQWVLNYTDSKNYILFQMDDNNFYRTIIRNGEKRDQVIIIPDKGEKRSFRTLQIRVSPTELVHQIKHGDRWTVLDRWTLPGANLSTGKFGFYLPGSDEVALTGFAHYVELNIR